MSILEYGEVLMKIFISYANTDKDIYNELTGELVKAGHTILDIDIGENIHWCQTVRPTKGVQSDRWKPCQISC